MSKRRQGAPISLAGMGFDLAAAVGVGALLGWWIDGRYETGPWGVVICSSVGIVGGLVNFIRAAQVAARRAEAQAAAERDE
jgi:F0F1-type ATP synthase assembly protein I